MMYSAAVISNIVHKLKISPGGAAAILDQVGIDTLFVALRREGDPHKIIINDFIGGAWGIETEINIPAHEGDQDAELHFKFNGEVLEYWTLVESGSFPRFNADYAQNVGFARFQGARCEGNTLRSALEPAYKTVSDIEGYILSRRLDALEGRHLMLNGE